MLLDKVHRKEVETFLRKVVDSDSTYCRGRIERFPVLGFDLVIDSPAVSTEQLSRVGSEIGGEREASDIGIFKRLYHFPQLNSLPLLLSFRVSASIYTSSPLTFTFKTSKQTSTSTGPHLKEPLKQ